MADENHLMRELFGDKCRCGISKRPRHTFCNACYYSLPKERRLSLYREFGRGYEEAYAAAVKILDEKEETRAGRYERRSPSA